MSILHNPSSLQHLAEAAELLYGQHWCPQQQQQHPSHHLSLPQGTDPPDFGGELHPGFDDQGPVGVHGHAGLPLHDESAAGERHQNHIHTSGPIWPLAAPLSSQRL